MRAVLLAMLLNACGGGGAGGGGDGGGGGNDPYAQARVHCVDVINAKRATVGAAPLARWTDGEACADSQAKDDAATGVAHGGFRKIPCGAFAQNECPGWPNTPISTLDGCLQAMWNEGPGGGHYENMRNKSYKQVACGFAVDARGELWALQNFK
jgi:hypothetical protein